MIPLFQIFKNNLSAHISNTSPINTRVFQYQRATIHFHISIQTSLYNFGCATTFIRSHSNFFDRKDFSKLCKNMVEIFFLSSRGKVFYSTVYTVLDCISMLWTNFEPLPLPTHLTFPPFRSINYLRNGAKFLFVRCKKKTARR